MKINKIVKSITHRDQIPNLLNNMEKPTIIEIGVQFGDHLGKMLTENVKSAYAVDSWRSTENIGQNDSAFTQEELDNQYKNVCERFHGDERVKFIREFSREASLLFDDETFDFIYIDADHTYEAVIIDLESWYPKLKVGGVISGHDYIDGDYTLSIGHRVRFGVIDAVSEFRKKNRIDDDNFHVSDEQYASFFIIKN